MNIGKKLLLARYSRALLSLHLSQTGNEYIIMNPKIVLNKRKLKQRFKRIGIHEQDDFTNALHALFRGQSHQQFNAMTDLLAGLTESDRYTYIHSITGNEQQKYKLTVANQYLWRLPSGILAYDCVEIVYMCWAGRKLGYLTKDLYLKYLEDTMIVMKKAYIDRKQMMAAYYVGKAYNSPSLFEDYVSQNQVLLTKLMTSRRSPLSKFKLQRQ